MTKAKIDQLKTQVLALSSNPIIDTYSDVSLKTSLENEKQSYNQALSQNSELSSQLIQSKTKVTELQKEYENLVAQKSAQTSLIAKVDSYLSDFNENASSDFHNGNLTPNLTGESST